MGLKQTVGLTIDSEVYDAFRRMVRAHERHMGPLVEAFMAAYVNSHDSQAREPELPENCPACGKPWMGKRIKCFYCDFMRGDEMRACNACGATVFVGELAKIRGTLKCPKCGAIGEVS